MGKQNLLKYRLCRIIRNLHQVQGGVEGQAEDEEALGHTEEPKENVSYVVKLTIKHGGVVITLQ